MILTGGELLAKVFGLATIAHLARVLGPETYGALELAIAVAFWFSLLIDAGLSTYGAREIARNRETVARYTTHIIAIKLVLSVAAFTVLVTIVSLIQRPRSVELLILAYGLTLLVSPGMLSWVYQGLGQMQAVAVASIIRWLVFAAGAFLLVRGPSQAWFVPLVEAFALIAVATFYVRSLVHRGALARQRLSLALAWSMLRQAWFIGASEVVWALRIHAATVLLGLMISDARLGWYAAALRIIVSLHTFVWLYFFNLLPSLSRCAQGGDAARLGRSRLLGLTANSMQMTAWVAILIGLSVTMLASPLIRGLYGSAYEETADVLRVLVWFIPLTLLNGHYRYTLVAFGMQRLELLSQIGAAGLNLGLYILLVPVWGLAGAAWSLIASEVLLTVLTYWFTLRTVVRMPFWPHLLRPLTAGALVTALLYVLRSSNVWVVGCLALMLYGASCYVMQPGLITSVRSLLVGTPATRGDTP